MPQLSTLVFNVYVYLLQRYCNNPNCPLLIWAASVSQLCIMQMAPYCVITQLWAYDNQLIVDLLC